LQNRELEKYCQPKNTFIPRTPLQSARFVKKMMAGEEDNFGAGF